MNTSESPNRFDVENITASSGAPLKFMLALAVTVVFVMAGCESALDDYQCTSDSDCNGGPLSGRCEATLYCSSEDTSCVSGRRYGEVSGPVAEECVGEGEDDLPTDEEPAVQETCDQQFGEASRYEYCSGTSNSCSFGVNLDFESCDFICRSLGGECLSARLTDEEDIEPCTGPGSFGVACDSFGIAGVCECEF